MEQSKQKIISYLDDYINSDFFQLEVVNERKKIGIPVGGLPFKDKDNRAILIKLMHDSIFVPKELLEANTKIKAISQINFAIKRLSKKFPIHNFLLDSVFKLYLLYDIKFYDGLKTLMVGTHQNIQDTSLCGVGAFKYIKTNSPRFKCLLEDYPVFIKINPSTSQRDLVDYIRNNWILINGKLNLYKNTKSKLGKVKVRNEKISTRNEFIYKNKNLPLKKIFKLVSEKYDEVLDEGHIGKIISLERKRRRDV